MFDYKTEKHKISPSAAGALGLMAGAAVGGAVASVMSDKKKKQKVMDKFDDLKLQAMTKWQQAKDQSFDQIDGESHRAKRKTTRKRLAPATKH